MEWTRSSAKEFNFNIFVLGAKWSMQLCHIVYHTFFLIALLQYFFSFWTPFVIYCCLVFSFGPINVLQNENVCSLFYSHNCLYHCKRILHHLIIFFSTKFTLLLAFTLYYFPYDICLCFLTWFLFMINWDPSVNHGFDIKSYSKVSYTWVFCFFILFSFISILWTFVGKTMY